MTTKTSILLFYLTLSKNQQLFRWMTFATLLVVNVGGLALTILNILQCHAVSAAFANPTPATAKCTDIVTIYLSSSPVNIITDLAILFLPMPILTSMRLPRKQKIILIITFSFGAFVAVVDVIRIAYLQAAFQVRLREIGTDPAASKINQQDDFSWYASLSFMWSAIEVHVGILCACVPSLKPLASKILPSILRDTSDPNDLSDIDKEERISTHFDSQGQRSPPVSPRYAANMDHESGDMGMMDFLTTPDMTEPIRSPTTIAPRNSTKSRPRAGSLTFFDLKSKKSMVKMTNKESYAPLALVTILFFLWGFAYGLLAILNAQFQLVVHMTTGQSLGLHAAYFGAYFVGPLTFGQYIFKKYGFRACFIVGLCIYGCGTLIFWPSAVLTSFPAFLISNFIVGLGVSILEIAGNPFVILCGPPEHAETRLNLSQGVQAIGSVISPILAQKVLFKSVNDGPSLIDVQWTYLGIALFVVLLALAFYYMPIPEASDEDFEEIAERRRPTNHKLVSLFPGGFKVPIVYLTLSLAIFSQFCYVGGQEAVAGVFLQYIPIVQPNSAMTPFNYQAIAHTTFALGRFLTAALGFFIRPRWILLTLYIGCIVTSALAMSAPAISGTTASTMLVLILTFESGIFSLVFAIGLRGLGAYTKTGSAFLTAATSGGAIWPVIMNPVIEARGLQYSFCVVVAVFAAGSVFPVYLTLCEPAKQQVDPVKGAGVFGASADNSAVLNGDRRPGSPMKTARRRFSEALRRKKRSSDVPGVEHIESNGRVDANADSDGHARRLNTLVDKDMEIWPG